MKHIVIRNFGPLKEVDVNLGRMNLIIGLQGSGKSCVMMIACYCTWVEKRISLRQSSKEFEEGTSFIDMLTNYYRAKEYVHDNMYVSYETEFMKFSYDQTIKRFNHKWKPLRWKYKRPKVSYVPAERNMVSLVSNWNRLETNYDNILDFKEDWDVARGYVKREGDILGTGISYEYDESSGIDNIITKGGKPVRLTNSSSGMQSLIPQYVHIDYLTKGIYEYEKDAPEITYSEKQLVLNLLDTLYRRNIEKNNNVADNIKNVVVIHLEGKDFVFKNDNIAAQFYKEATNLLFTDHAEIFLEEPENNLFPPTQCQLVNWLVDRNGAHNDRLFVATHSPYILNQFIKLGPKGFNILFTHPSGNEERTYDVRQLTEEEMHEMYDNGVDMFFNFELYV